MSRYGLPDDRRYNNLNLRRLPQNPVGITGVQGNINNLGQLQALLKKQAADPTQVVTSVQGGRGTVTLYSPDNSIGVINSGSSDIGLQVTVPLLSGSFPSTPFAGEIVFRQDAAAPSGAGFYIYTGGIGNLVASYPTSPSNGRVVLASIFNTANAPLIGDYIVIGYGNKFTDVGTPNTSATPAGDRFAYVPGTPQSRNTADYTHWIYKQWNATDYANLVASSSYCFDFLGGGNANANSCCTYQLRGVSITQPFGAVGYYGAVSPGSYNINTPITTGTQQSFAFTASSSIPSGGSGVVTIGAPFTVDVATNYGGGIPGKATVAHDPNIIAAGTAINPSFNDSVGSGYYSMQTVTVQIAAWTFIGPLFGLQSLDGLTGAITTESTDNSVSITAVSSSLLNFIVTVPEGTSFTAGPVAGQLFYRTDLTSYYVYNGSAWVQVNSVVNFGTTNPSVNLAQGQMFFRTDTGLLQYYSGSAWVPIGNVIPSGTSFPSSPISGQEFFRTDLGLDFIYTGGAWVPISSSVTYGTTNPVTAYQGELFYNTTSASLQYYNGSAWVGVGAGAGVTQITGPGGVETGALTFTGAGVSNSGTTFTFSGGGGGGSSAPASYDLMAEAEPGGVYYWPLSDASGGAVDLLQGYNLTAVGSPGYHAASLIASGDLAMSFASTGNYLQGSESLVDTNNNSLLVVLKYPALPAAHSTFFTTDYGSSFNKGYSFDVTTNGHIHIIFQGVTDFDTGYVIAAGTVYSLLFAYADGVMRMFVNGVLQYTTSSTTPIVSPVLDGMRIGGGGNAGQGGQGVVIQKVLWASTTMPVQRALAYYNAANAGAYTFPGGVGLGIGTNVSFDQYIVNNAFFMNYYKLNDASGTVATDAMGNANGTYHGTFLYQQIGLIPDGNPVVLFRQAQSNYVSINDPTTSATAFAMMAALRLGTRPSDTATIIFSNYDGTSAGRFSVYVNTDQTLHLFHGGTDTALGNPIGPGVTHLVILVFDGTNINVYLDGILVYSAAFTYTKTNLVQVGAEDTTIDYFDGAIGKVGIGTIGFTQAQVATIYQQFQLAQQVTAIVSPTATTYDATVLSDAPTHFWPCNDAASATSAADFFGGSPLTAGVGTLSFGSKRITQDGESSAFTYNAASNFIGTLLIPTAYVPTSVGSISFEFVINSRWSGTNQTIFALIGASGHFELYRNTAGNNWGYYNGSSAYTFGFFAYSPALYHVVLTWDGSNMKCYLNGWLEGNAAYSPVVTTPTAADCFFGSIGNIAKCAIYNGVALTQAQVLKHYAQV